MADKINTQEKALAEDMVTLKKEAAYADKERQTALDEVWRLKSKLSDQTLEDEIRHNYVYHILFNNWKAWEHMIKHGDMERKPYKPVFPDLEKVDFRLPENKSLYELSGDTHKLLNHIDPIDNGYFHYPQIDDVAKQNIDVDFFNIDRLNTINKKRMHQLSSIDAKPTDPDLDQLDRRLFNFLDWESTLPVPKYDPKDDS